jgi:hypothetical protein
MTILDKDITRFWAKVDRQTDDECWLWTAGMFKQGYGQFWINNTQIYASRMAYCIVNSLDPFELKDWILHSCDVRRCCNPKHLRRGTAKENAEDRESRNRRKILYGQAAGNAKITEIEMHEICRLRTLGYTQLSIAMLFGISQTQVSRIVHNKNWRHLAKLGECDKLMKSSKRLEYV